MEAPYTITDFFPSVNVEVECAIPPLAPSPTFNFDLALEADLPSGAVAQEVLRETRRRIDRKKHTARGFTCFCMAHAETSRVADGIFIPAMAFGDPYEAGEPEMRFLLARDPAARARYHVTYGWVCPREECRLSLHLLMEQHLNEKWAPVRRCWTCECAEDRAGGIIMRRCSECLLPHYCSVDCQHTNWPAHRDAIKAYPRLRLRHERLHGPNTDS